MFLPVNSSEASSAILHIGLPCLPDCLIYPKHPASRFSSCLFSSPSTYATEGDESFIAAHNAYRPVPQRPGADRHKDNETSRDRGEGERGEGDVSHNRDARDEMD